MLRLCCYSKNGKQLKSTILCNRVTVLKHNEFRKQIKNKHRNYEYPGHISTTF